MATSLSSEEVDHAIDLVLAVHRDDQHHVRRLTSLAIGFRAARAGQESPAAALSQIAPVIITMVTSESGGDQHLAGVLGDTLTEWGRTGANRSAGIGIARALLAFLQPAGADSPEGRVPALLTSLREPLKRTLAAGS